MTDYSQNGWVANDRSRIKTWQIPGTSRVIALEKGAGGYLLTDFAAWFDKAVEDIEDGQLDDWGYAERLVRGGTDISNHASGTAIDLNAVKHPLGAVGTFKPAQVVAIRKKLMDYRGAIRWGGDYTGRKDEMHFEINTTPAMANAIADEIQAALENDVALTDSDKDWILKNIARQVDIGWARDQICLNLGFDNVAGGPKVNGKNNPGLQPARKVEVDAKLDVILAMLTELKGTPNV